MKEKLLRRRNYCGVVVTLTWRVRRICRVEVDVLCMGRKTGAGVGGHREGGMYQGGVWVCVC